MGHQVSEALRGVEKFHSNHLVSFGLLNNLKIQPIAMNRIFAALISCLTVCSAFAQSNIVTAGGEAANATGSVSYTIGQIDFQYTSSADYSVSEGVQQAYSFDTALSIDDVQYDFQLSIWPNPSTDEMNIEYTTSYELPLSLTVTDVKGAVIASKSVTQGQYSFDVNTWAAGIYYVNLNNGEAVNIIKPIIINR